MQCGAMPLEKRQKESTKYRTQSASSRLELPMRPFVLGLALPKIGCCTLWYCQSTVPSSVTQSLETETWILSSGTAASHLSDSKAAVAMLE